MNTSWCRPYTSSSLLELQDEAAELLRSIALLCAVLLSNDAKAVMDDLWETAVLLHDNALLVRVHPSPREVSVMRQLANDIDFSRFSSSNVEQSAPESRCE